MRHPLRILWIFAAVGVALGLVVGFARRDQQDSAEASPATASSASSSAASTPPPATSSKPAKPKGVLYEVEGNGTTGDVTYMSVTGSGSTGEDQLAETPLPWSTTIDDSRLGIYSLVAQLHDGSSITCRITVNGKVIAEHTSTGQYAAVSCAGSR